MTIDLIILFIVLNVLNVIIQTVKSITTINCGKTIAAITNAIAYGLYTIVVVYMVCDLPLWFKVVVIGGANLIGVYLVKLFEEKKRKDKMWKFEGTMRADLVNQEFVNKTLKDNNIPHNFVNAGKYTIINCYCKGQKESAKVIAIFKDCNIKYFVSETKM